MTHLPMNVTGTEMTEVIRLGAETIAKAMTIPPELAQVISETSKAITDNMPWALRPTSLSTALAEDCAAVNHAGRGRACMGCGAVVEEPWGVEGEVGR